MIIGTKKYPIGPFSSINLEGGRSRKRYVLTDRGRREEGARERGMHAVMDR